MSKKSVAIVAIHGMGNLEGISSIPESDELVFSNAMRERLVKRINRDQGAGHFERNFAWREVVYGPILQQRQTEYLKKIEPKLRWDSFRKFVLYNLADAASYRWLGSSHEPGAYQKIHAQIDKVMSELEGDIEPGAPVIILGYSLGCYIITNHIWDHHKGAGVIHEGDTPSSFRAMKQVAALMTFGCNIPVFSFAHAGNSISAISAPNTELPEVLQRETWWENYYDRDDILAYPLGVIEGDYSRLVDTKQLVERQINAGGLISGATPLSHVKYWTDDDILSAAERLLISVFEQYQSAKQAVRAPD